MSRGYVSLRRGPLLRHCGGSRLCQLAWLKETRSTVASACRGNYSVIDVETEVFLLQSVVSAVFTDGGNRLIDSAAKLDKTETVSKFETWKNLSLSMKYGNQKEIIESVQHIATISQPMFEELYKLNEQITASKEDSLVKAKWGMILN
jgi:hypothetical protein